MILFLCSLRASSPVMHTLLLAVYVMALLSTNDRTVCSCCQTAAKYLVVPLRNLPPGVDLEMPVTLMLRMCRNSALGKVALVTERGGKTRSKFGIQY
jgi:hypothetical protein